MLGSLNKLLMNQLLANYFIQIWTIIMWNDRLSFIKLCYEM